ncbi:MAG: phospholipase C/P1 nuclease family protein [Thermodesulfovibrionales bacterium]
MRRELLITIMILVLSAEALCYEVMVHEKISSSVIKISTIDAFLRTNLKLQLTDGFENRTIQEWLEKGSNWEDNNPRWLNHFYDPRSGQGLTDMVSGRPSLEWGRDYWSNDWNWKKARQFYYFALTQSSEDKRQAKYAAVFRSLGHIIHLIHDLAVPAHVRNDSHPYKTDNYFQQQRDMYEKYTNAAISPENGLPKLKYDGYPAVDLTTFNNFEAFWIGGGGKGLAEFTNRSFLSHDTNIDDAKYQAPVPTGEWITKETIIDPWMGSMEFEVKYLQGYVADNYRPELSSPITRLAAFSYFDFEMQKYGYDQRVYSLNNKIHQEYSDFLIPRSVGYSAGLLNYFFRGDIRLEYTTDPTPGYVIANKTDEDMDGLIQILYDNKSDKREVYMSGNFSIKANKSSDIFNITSPADAKEPGKYTLVFKGTMGNEKGAVAGYVTSRLLEITPPEQFIYSLVDASKPDPYFRTVRAKVKNASTSEQMGSGTVQAIAKYKLDTYDAGFIYSMSASQAIDLSSNAVEIEFNFENDPIPLDVTDLYLEIVFKGTIGSETNAVASGVKDISEPTPIDLFNDTDKSCVNGNWYPTAGAIDLMDTSSPKDHIADTWDVNPHILQNIYIKISSMEDPQIASPSLYNAVVPNLDPGQFKRAVYILTDHKFKYSFYSTWRPPPAFIDHWAQSNNVHSFNGTAVKNQTDYLSEPAVCGKDPWCYIYRYPVYYSIRGNAMWWAGGVVFINAPYPDNSSCQGY